MDIQRPEEVRGTEIDEEAGMLRWAVDAAEQAVVQLGDKLRSVRSPLPPSAGKRELPPERLSPLGRELQDLRLRAQRVESQVREIMGSLEIGA